MTIVFAGGELDAFTINGTTPLESATSSRFDPNFARRALRPLSTANMQADFSAPLTEGWLHLNIYHQSVFSSLQDQSYVLLQDVTAGITGMQLDADNGIFNLEYWNGSGFTELSPDLNMTNDVTGGNRIDMHWRIADSGGIFEVYVDGRFITSFEGDTLNGFTQFDRALIRSPSNFTSDLQTAYYSEIIIADVETIGWHLATIEPDGAGNSTTWTGTFSDVDAGSLNDATFVSSGTAEEVEQFTVGNISTESIVMNFEGLDGATSGPGFNNIGKGNQPTTIAGTSQIDTAQTPAGGDSTSSLLLDGNSDYVAWTDNGTFALGSSRVTISAWIRLNATGVTQNIATQYDFNSQRSWRFDVSPTNVLGFHASDDGIDANGHVNLVGGTLTTGVDHHVAAVRKANGDWVLFLDGNIEDGPTTPTGNPHNSTGQLRIGVTANNVNFFNGWIDSFELVIGIARWSAPFTPPTGNLGVTSLDVKALIVAARSRNVAVGPQNLQMAIRTGGTDFFSSNLAISTSFATGNAIVFDTNPNTSANWTVSEINVLEIGLKSKP